MMDSNNVYRISERFTRLLTNRLTLVAILILASVAWACSSVTTSLTRTAYSIPQDSISQWLVEYRPGSDKVQLTLRYESPHRDSGGWGSHSTSFSIAPDQLQGLTREQAMSGGTHVQFQLK